MKSFVLTPWPVSAPRMRAASRRGTALLRRRKGFTVIELLMAMAAIVFLMSVLSQTFSAGLESFRQLKGIGDLPEQLRAAAIDLREDLDATGARARAFITTGVRTGTVDPEGANDLRERYEVICAAA